MIPDRHAKVEIIADFIRHGLKGADPFSQEQLLAYRRVLDARQRAPQIWVFLTKEANLRLLYDALIAWDMNARAARLKRFAAFSDSVLHCASELIRLERACGAPRSEFMASLSAVYDGLHVMESSARLISNAKLLHFLFPHHLMPVDGQHTLTFLYGHVAYQPASRYLEIITFQQDVLGRVTDWQMHLDERWNTTGPKLVDNAIILWWRNPGPTVASAPQPP